MITEIVILLTFVFHLRQKSDSHYESVKYGSIVIENKTLL